MIFRISLALSLAVVLAGQPIAFAASAPLELKWNELNATIYNKTVELTVPGAVTVKGDVAAVREDGLVLDIRKTSDPKQFPKGNAMIPRASVTLLKVEQHGSNWRTMGTVIGSIGGVALGGYIAAKTANSEGAGVAIFITTASAAAIAGHIAGGSADRKTKMIRVVP
jgi:hypothetical protein